MSAPGSLVEFLRRWLPNVSFVWIGFYADLPVPLTKRVVVLDAGWRWHHDSKCRYRIWSLGWRYAR